MIYRVFANESEKDQVSAWLDRDAGYPTKNTAHAVTFFAHPTSGKWACICDEWYYHHHTQTKVCVEERLASGDCPSELPRGKVYSRAQLENWNWFPEIADV